ncbi:glycosyltransferase, partial [Ideonella sp. A 288]|uniref:glycosyltransferase n=1 Tax=Ideonella sp. A 288 TaxID=1962181 RepID=UPI0038558812
MTASAPQLLVAFATAWGPRFGGINAFNHDLLLALAPACRASVKVVCVVLHATPEQCQAALAGEVLLVPLGLDAQQNMTVDLEPLVRQVLQAHGLAELHTGTVWLGHDRITGAIALQAAKARGGRAALIHHMSYAHYEAFAENSAAADVKAREQKALFKSADHVMAIGPLLRQALADMLDCPTDQVKMLVPGLADIQPKQHHHNFNTFVSGRLDASAGRIKQGQLSVAAFGHAVYLCDHDPGLPDKLRGEAEPSLTLRGVDFEHVLGAGLSAQEADLRRYAEGIAQRAINLRALPFTEDRNALFDDLRSASLCLMPSWHEGFGLVAWEAIAAGVPLIAGKKSGVVQLLSTLQGGQYMAWLQTIDVRGQTDEPFFRDDDKALLSRLVIQTAKDHGAWKDRAARLRESLLPRYSWRNCAEDLITAIGWQVVSPVASLADIPLASTSPPAETAAVATAAPTAVGSAKAHAANSLNSWLDPLGPRWESAHGLSPAQLLRAEEALLPFAQQAEPFLAAQLHWAHADELPLTVRLLVAQGGSGKTRLAIELCARLRHDGWLAGFLVGDGNPGSMTSLAAQLRDCRQPVCIVVDYAETRTAELLALLAAVLANPRTAATRILLLARSGGEWWQQLPARDARCEALLMGAAGTGPYLLPAVYPKPSDRDQAFQHALQLLTTKLRLPMPAARPNLRGEHFARPLYVQLAALMTALGEHAESAEALPRALLNHEQRYWGRAMHSPLHEVAGQDAVRLMVLATLLGEVAVPNDVRDAWAAAGGEQQVLLPLFRALIPLYPGRQGLQGLRPDMVGEALVAHAVLSVNGPALLDAVLGASLSKARYAALTVLARASKQRADLALPLEDALARHFARCASEVLRVCIDTPNELPQIAKRAYVRLAPAVAHQIAGALLPSFESEVVPMTGLEVEMRRTVHDAAKRKKDKRNATVNDKASFAAAISNLGEALRRDGKAKCALQCADQARLLFRELVQANRDRYEPDWAMSLNNYANHLSEAGRTDEALAFAKQALDIHQRLALGKPERYESDWATSLSNYANRLSEAG